MDLDKLNDSKSECSDIQNQYKEIKAKFNEFLQQAKRYRAVWEVRSYVNENFYEGNHRIVFDRTTKQLVTLPLKSDNFFAIGKIRKIVRGVRNMITKNEPRWHVRHMIGQNLTEEERLVAVALLSQIYKQEHIKDKLKDLITHSLTKTSGWAYVGFDNRKGDIDIFIEDPFNIYTSPDGKLEGPIFVGKYIIRTVRKSLSDIKNSELYNKGKFAKCLEKIQPEHKMAESDLKNATLQSSYKIPVDENGTAIVKELYVLEPIKKENKKEDGNPELKDTISVEEDQLFLNDARVRIITMVGDLVIRDDLTELTQYPFLCYQAERDKGQIYGASWIEPLIDLNRSLNESYSNRADWLEHFAKGRFLVQKGSSFTAIKGKNGQIIEYTGTRPVPMETGILPQEVNIHISETERYMEDIGGIHSESMGRLSGTAISGVAIAQLQAADNNNVSEPVDNLKTFIEELAYRILYLASKYYKLQDIIVPTLGKVSIIGREVKQNITKITGKDFETKPIEIKPLKNIEVEIIPGSAFSDLQMRQDLIELKSLGMPIPDSLIIDAYKLGNTDEIISRYEQEQQKKLADNDGIEGLEANQRELENKKMLNGYMIAVQPGENHEIHLAIHGAVLNGIKDIPGVLDIFINHMKQHESQLRVDKQIPPQKQREQQKQQFSGPIEGLREPTEPIPVENIGQ